MNHQTPETKNWQIALFSLNGISSNTALTIMGTTCSLPKIFWDCRRL